MLALITELLLYGVIFLIFNSCFVCEKAMLCIYIPYVFSDLPLFIYEILKQIQQYFLSLGIVKNFLQVRLENFLWQWLMYLKIIHYINAYIKNINRFIFYTVRESKWNNRNIVITVSSYYITQYNIILCKIFMLCHFSKNQKIFNYKMCCIIFYFEDIKYIIYTIYFNIKTFLWNSF